MRPETVEWVGKAEADFASMIREMNTPKDFNYDLVCFRATISRLDRYAVEFRYPGASATQKLAAEAVEGV